MELLSEVLEDIYDHIKIKCPKLLKFNCHGKKCSFQNCSLVLVIKDRIKNRPVKTMKAMMSLMPENIKDHRLSNCCDVED